jgi:hypothetical protein
LNTIRDDDSQPDSRRSEQDHAEAMAQFCRKAGIILHQVIGPLEMLNHLLYLAHASDDPTTTRQYLTEAREQARTVVTAHADLLEAYPGPRLETS